MRPFIVIIQLTIFVEEKLALKEAFCEVNDSMMKVFIIVVIIFADAVRCLVHLILQCLFYVLSCLSSWTIRKGIAADDL